MVLAIPGGRGLFGALQHTLARPDGHRVRITRDVRDALDDFETLGRSLAERPTRLGEIVPNYRYVWEHTTHPAPAPEAFGLPQTKTSFGDNDSQSKSQPSW